MVLSQRTWRNQGDTHMETSFLLVYIVLEGIFQAAKFKKAKKGNQLFYLNKNPVNLSNNWPGNICLLVE